MSQFVQVSKGRSINKELIVEVQAFNHYNYIQDGKSWLHEGEVDTKRPFITKTYEKKIIAFVHFTGQKEDYGAVLYGDEAELILIATGAGRPENEPIYYVEGEDGQ